VTVTIIPVTGVPEVRAGDDLADALLATDTEFIPGDVLVITQKVVSKAEGRTASTADKASAIAGESRRVLRRSGGMTIAETHHGFVCANAGVDSSNIEGDLVVLLPEDPDASARRIRARIKHLSGLDVAIVITDTFGRAWRVGQTDVAIGVAGLDPFVDYRGTYDTQGRELSATRICIADEIAGAAELVMGKARGVCAAIVRGAGVARARGSARDIVRAPAEDLFR
jgi:coenzyme F420-0:L-glutamate ligase / coenzyme F420-1:gamma-L-glutamate ligase